MQKNVKMRGEKWIEIDKALSTKISVIVFRILQPRVVSQGLAVRIEEIAQLFFASGRFA